MRWTTSSEYEFQPGPAHRGSVLMSHGGVLSCGASPSRFTLMPATVPGPGSTARATTVATARPVLARPLRLSVSTWSGRRKLSSTRLRSIRPAGMNAPSVAGTTQRR